MSLSEHVIIDLDSDFAIHESFVNLSDEVSDLQVVEHFLAAVERQFLKKTSIQFDTNRVHSALSRLEDLTQASFHVDIKRLENVIETDIKRWYAYLEKRDSEIEAYHIRRFCDAPNQHLDSAILSALTRFYRNLEHSPSVQSKFDLVITRLFSKVTEAPLRKLLIEKEDIAEQLVSLFEGWDYVRDVEARKGHSPLALAKLDDFTREINSFEDFQSLADSKIFDRLRAFKQKIGKLYYHPDVAAAAIECNVMVGNLFHSLLAKANSPLSSKLRSGVDLAGAFHDTSPNADSRISDILSEIGGSGPAGIEKDVSMGDLLELVGEFEEREVVVEEQIEFEFEEPSPPKEETPSAQKRLEPFFFALSQPVPDKRVLLDHLRRFRAIADIDLNEFIGAPEDPHDHLRRSTLGVILWIEELCENELNQRGEMAGHLKNELHRLLKKSEEYSDELEYLIDKAGPQDQRRLLIVSNKLLEARLKLKRAIARFTRRSLSQAEADERPAAASVSVAASASASGASRVRRPTNRWLIAATLVVSVLSGGIYFFDQQMKQILPPAVGIELLDLSKIAQGDHLQQAYRKSDKVFVTARDSWAKLNREEQIASLESLRDHPGPNKVKTVVVTDGMGRVLGDITIDGTRLFERMQIAENEAK